MINYKHYCGPKNPICQYPGTRVLNPFHNPDNLTQEEALELLVVADSRSKSRFKGSREAVTIRSK